jgi:hypothetical protein
VLFRMFKIFMWMPGHAGGDEASAGKTATTTHTAKNAFARHLTYFGQAITIFLLYSDFP